MNERALLASARNLPRVPKESATAYVGMGDTLAAAVTARMLAHGEIQSLIGPNNLGMMIENHRHHARFIGALLNDFNPAVLVRTVLWVLDSYRAHGFQPRFWVLQLDAWLHVLEEHLPEDIFADIAPVYEWLKGNICAFISLSDRKLAGL